MNLLEKDIKLYEAVIKTRTEDISFVLINTLKKYYDDIKIEDNHDYIIAVGDIPIALVAHIDTVFPDPPHDIYYDPIKEIIWSLQGGIGDDRVGIFLIIKLLLQTDFRPYIFFMNDEEYGGLGTMTLIKDFPLCPWDIKFFIELDRHGRNDAVFYNCNNTDFIKYICNFGFTKQKGIFSDISIICPAWNIAGVNFSVGYENEHSLLEIWNVLYGFKTYLKLQNILLEINNSPHFKYKKRN